MRVSEAYSPRKTSRKKVHGYFHDAEIVQGRRNIHELDDAERKHGTAPGMYLSKKMVVE